MLHRFVLNSRECNESFLHALSAHVIVADKEMYSQCNAPPSTNQGIT